MSLPTPTDLQLYLGTTNIDTDRATLMLGLAEDLCSTIVTPLPDTARSVILAVAGRAFVNPEGVTSETVGPYTVQRPNAGLYLTRGDKSTLRRLAGGSGAFSIDTLPTGVDAVQLVTVTATGGTWTVSLTGQSTTALAYNASSGAVLAALSGLSLIGAGNVSVTGEGPYSIAFINDLGTTPIPNMVPNASGLTGPTPSVTVSTVTPGVFKPGQNLAPWDRDLFRSRR